MSSQPAGTSLPSRALLPALLWHRRWAFLLDAAIGASFYLIGMVPGLVMREFFDALQMRAPNFNAVAASLLVVLVVVKLVHVSMGILWMAVDTVLRGALLRLLRRKLLWRLLAFPAGTLTVPLGDALSRLVEDVRQAIETLCKREGLMNLTSSLSFSFIAVAVMLQIDVRVTVLALVPTVVVLLASFAAGQRVERYRARSRQAAGNVSDLLAEAFAGVQAIQLANTAGRVVARLDRANAARREAEVRDGVLSASLVAASRFVVALATGFVLLVAARAIREQTFSVGDLALFVYLMAEVGIGLTVAGQFIVKWRQSEVAVARLGELQQDQPIRELIIPVEPVAPSPHLVPAAGPLQRLELRELTYHYPEGTRALQDVSLALSSGTMTVVAGLIGSGKTTLLRCLLGLAQADSGRVVWNDVEVNEPAQFMVPPRCAYAPQRPELFSDTIRNNILLGMRSSGEIETRAASLAGLDADVAELPDGLDTHVGVGGLRLSGGQVQRLALARVFARSPDLMVLDDVFSALDVRTEGLLWGNLAEFTAAGGTVLVVSNRLETLAQADTIIVLHEGAVVTKGTLQEALEASPQLRAVWEEQADPRPRRGVSGRELRAADTGDYAPRLDW